MKNLAGRRWLSPREVAERLGLHVQSVYALASRGELPSGRVGRCLRIDWPAVEKKLEGQAGPPGSQNGSAPQAAGSRGGRSFVGRENGG